MACLGNYLSDFIFTSTSTINLDADLIYSETTIEQCSKQCVTADGFKCKSFDFCQNSKKCLINKELKKESKFQNGSIATDSCDNYKS